MLTVAYFTTIVDLKIVSVSLPTIGRDLHVTATSLQWVATAYALAFGGLLLFGGRGADLLSGPRSRSGLDPSSGRIRPVRVGMSSSHALSPR